MKFDWWKHWKAAISENTQRYISGGTPRRPLLTLNESYEVIKGLIAEALHSGVASSKRLIKKPGVEPIKRHTHQHGMPLLKQHWLELKGHHCNQNSRMEYEDALPGDSNSALHCPKASPRKLLREVEAQSG